MMQPANAPPNNNIGVHAIFSKIYPPSALDSIRIAKENYKPFVKTA